MSEACPECGSQNHADCGESKYANSGCGCVAIVIIAVIVAICLVAATIDITWFPDR